MEVVANQCAKRCGLCCEQDEFTCGDDEASPIDCIQNRHKCRDPEWTYVMEYFCPGTCGTCLSGSFCRDLNLGCTTMRQLCNDMNFMGFMTARCARTCQKCNTTTLSTSVSNTTTSSCTVQCRDTATNCAANIGFCNNSQYFNLMSQKCPATCGRCSNYGISTCTDTNSNCAAWVSNGFCSNAFYSNEQKRQFCGKSCNLC
uniref:ShKT domain-containing protein n=1 Tax=Panagrolaimus davidi TaxID=227884 RepID=A0A914QS14_9BILA